MDIAGFLLASGFALLIVLLGWANQITSKNKETKELVLEFLKKANLKSKEYKKIIDEAGSTEDSFIAVVDFLYSSEKDNVEIFDKIKRVTADIKRLNTKYIWRFWILLLMSICLFLSGTVALIYPPYCKVCMFIPNAIFVIIVYFNLITTQNLEKRYVKNISEAMEKL